MTNTADAIRQISAVLTAYHPSFAHKDYTPVVRWLAEGYDLERDILPAIREWTARKADIHSLGFFWPYVDAQRTARQQKETTNPEAIHRKARNIAYLIRHLGRSMPTDERWLAAYEKKYGKVVLHANRPDAALFNNGPELVANDPAA